jgi:hypothetical protein
MLLSIDSAKKILPNACLVFSAGTIASAYIFVFPVFGKLGISNLNLFFLVSLFGLIGGGYGVYYKYLSKWGTTNALVGQIYFFISLEMMLVGGMAALAIILAGRPDLKFWALGTSWLALIISILLGIQRDAKKVKWWTAEALELADKRFAKHINYSTQQFMPYPIPTYSDQDALRSYGYLVIGVGTANIPLMFEIFTGQRTNAIFFAFPVLVGTFAYINFKKISTGVLNLILIRKLEKSVGYRFINADLEQIQDLRRTFFLSRWLMKDYVKPASASSAVQANLKP